MLWSWLMKVGRLGFVAGAGLQRFEVGRWSSIVLGVRRGRPLDSERHLSLTARGPWVEEGVSRATWYRRRRPAG